jgi:ribosomal protein S27E
VLFGCRRCGAIVYNLRTCEQCGKVLLDPFRGFRRLLRLMAQRLEASPRDCRP